MSIGRERRAATGDGPGTPGGARGGLGGAGGANGTGGAGGANGTGGAGGANGTGAGGTSVRLPAGPAPESRKANLSLWLGFAGLVLGFLLMFAILTPATIVTAVGALREIRLRPSLRGRWKAWTGIGLAIAAPVLWVSAFLAFAENGTFGLL